MRQLEAIFLFVRSFSGLFRVGKKRKSFVLGYLSGATHTLPVWLLAWFVLLSIHKLMQSFNQINAPFPGFATNFQWNPSSNMAELPIQPSYIVLHLGRWLVLFQLPRNKWGFNSSFISSERKTISMPFHFSVVWDCPDFTLAGSHQSCPKTQYASCIFTSTRPRTDVSLVLLHFWPGLMSHYKAEWPICNTDISFFDIAFRLKIIQFVLIWNMRVYMFHPKIWTEIFSFQTKEYTYLAPLTGRSMWIYLIFQINSEINLMAMDEKNALYFTSIIWF